MALTAGCTSPARRLVPNIAQQVTPGLTREQVEALVGKPGWQQEGPDGRLATYIYQRQRESARDDLFIESANYRFAGTLVYRMLTVLYGSSGIVERVKYSDTQTAYFEAFEPVPDWTRRRWVGKPITPEILQSVQKDVTTAAEVDLMFGEPTWTALSLQGEEIQGWFFGQWVGRNSFEWQWWILALQFDEDKVVRKLHIDSNVGNPERQNYFPAVQPPSIMNSVPVMKDDSSLAR